MNGNELEGHLAVISKNSGRTPAFTRELFSLCLKGSSLEGWRIAGRLLWLFAPEGLCFRDRCRDMDAATLAFHVIHPQRLLFEYIQERRPLGHGFLKRIYDSMALPGALPETDRTLPDLTEERILQEMKWWIVDLDFPQYYFAVTAPEEIGRHIRVNRLYEMQGMKTKSYESLKVSSMTESGTFMHWVHRSRATEVEREIEALVAPPSRLCDISVYAHGNLLLYLGAVSSPSGEGRGLDAVSPEGMSRRLAGEARARYSKLLREAVAAGRPVSCESRKAETGEYRLMLAFPFGYVRHFLSNVSKALASRGVSVTRKYCAVFGGDSPTVVSSFYSLTPFPSDIIARLVSTALYPQGAVSALVDGGVLSPDEANFLNAAAGFVHQFSSLPDPTVSFLRERFKDSSELQEVLRNLQRRIDKDAFSLPAVISALSSRPDLVKALFVLFEARFSAVGTHAPDGRLDDSFPSLLLKASLPPFENAVFSSSFKFVDAILRCNFFNPVKQAFAFRLRKGFLSGSFYAKEPFAVIYVKGRDFTGFHVRFKDIARGGIRILRPSSLEERTLLLGNAFEECYNLAFTQNLKNKDIPEGGAKGVVAVEIPGVSHAQAEESFKHYIDALLDMMLPPDGGTDGEEALFLGPDEGTAELMDWAARKAQSRGWRFWKCFTTGKRAELGGVSHIDYGMTTNGVREYVEGIYRKLGFDERNVTKVQTGGPDGDLGGNEILLSKERTLALIDGGGVLYDPNGLDREELLRLAKARLDSSHFTSAKLGEGAFHVRVADKEFLLPGVSQPVSSLAFRNSFHLDKRFRADLFVPCGGRPKSINATNWQALLDDSGRPAFKWIVEGANLFMTQEARIKLEERGVVIFKDSSTNKGGVTSSSLEVLSGLLLNDREYAELMVASPGQAVQDFRRRYIEDIVRVVRANARAEFELLWRLRSETGRPLSVLSDEISSRIVSMTDAINSSDLFSERKLRRAVLLLAIPETLLAFLGAGKSLRRMPLNYQRSLFARTLARNFVYRYGLDHDFEDYRGFFKELAQARLLKDSVCGVEYVESGKP